MAAAFLFDIDGTLIESDPIHLTIFQEIFAERGQVIDHAFYLNHIHGFLNADLFARHFPAEDAQALSDDKEARFRARLDARVPPMPGLMALLALARRDGIRVAAVTNAPRLNAEAMLNAIAARDFMEVLIVGEECPRGKPFPDPYLAAMAQLRVAPEACVAFEDSPTGVASARASGAFTIGLRSSLDHADLLAAGAQATIRDFTDPALPELLERVTRACA